MELAPLDSVNMIPKSMRLLGKREGESEKSRKIQYLRERLGRIKHLAEGQRRETLGKAERQEGREALAPRGEKGKDGKDNKNKGKW